MNDKPFTVGVSAAEATLTAYDNHIQRRLSNMKNIFADAAAYEAMLKQDDLVLYEVHEVKRPEIAGELLHGLSVVHPGLVGEEYFMTK